MTTKRDSEGHTLRADKNYRLRVPKDGPVGQFWSLTLYSENTRRPYDNGGTAIRSASLDSKTHAVRERRRGTKGHCRFGRSGFLTSSRSYADSSSEREPAPALVMFVDLTLT
jgi:hypothetical protein